MKVSIIIPVLNEAEHIVDTLASLSAFRHQGHEVIVVDGGSTDVTIAQAESLADKVLHSDRGRAIQMNTGIEAATGDVMLFLHADTRLPDDALNAITQTIAEGHFWGRFDVRLSGQQLMLRIIERMMNLRSCVTGIATGDQAIFISRECLDIVGQYSELPLMEDIDFSKRLREVDWPACLKNAVITSSRRWEDRGVWKTVLLMWRLRLLYFFGVPADKLARQYQ
jgi:rSAM/selenodomain-associated transferase 2